MNNTKQILETVVESQTKAINNFVETANRFQEAFKSGKALEQSTEIYKDWWDSQMSLFKNITTEANTEAKNTYETSQVKTEDFYKNVLNTQIEAIKKATEFNLDMYNTLYNYGKTPTEKNNHYHTLNTNWNTLFESWTKTLNSTFESLNKAMPTSFNKEWFENAWNTNTLYLKLQDFYTPFFNAYKSNNYSADALKSMFDPAQYKKITEEIFNSFYPTNNLNTLLQNNVKMIYDYITSQQNTNKQFQEYWNTYNEKFPHIFAGDWVKYTESFKTVNGSYSEFFAPLMKLVANNKEKENVQLAIDSLDKATIYSVKLAQMQHLLYTTGQKVATESMNVLTEKATNPTYTTSFQPFFNDWVNLNETTYTELFSTDEFSKLKAELTTLSMEIKKNLEKQFENRFEMFPIVVKSEMNDLYQTIHDLKKTIKNLEAKLNNPEYTTTATTKTTSKKVTA